MTWNELKAKWNERKASYALDGRTKANPGGLSVEEKKFIALIDELLADAHSAIPHSHDHNPPPEEPPGCHCTTSGLWSEVVKPRGLEPITIAAGAMVRKDIDTPPHGPVIVEGHLILEAPIVCDYLIAQHGGIVEKTKPGLISCVGPTEVPGMGTGCLVAHHGGKLLLRGRVPTVTWTRLSKHALPKERVIELMETPAGWKVGDEVVVSSSELDPAPELRRVEEITGNEILLDIPLERFHDASTVNGIERRAKVALLTRDIVIRGNGMHVMVMDDGSEGVFEGVDFDGLGQFGVKGRYPVHAHNMDNGGKNFHVVGCTIRNSVNRGGIIHKSNHTNFRDNVLCSNVGHNVFFEDGIEVRNSVKHNCIIDVRAGNLLDVSEFHGNGEAALNGAPAGIWVTNPDNDIEDNAVAGMERGNALHFAIRETVQPGSISAAAMPDYCPAAQPLGRITGNEANSHPLVLGNVATDGHALFVSSTRPMTFDGKFSAFSFGMSIAWSDALAPIVFKNLQGLSARFAVLPRANFTLEDCTFVLDEKITIPGHKRASIVAYEGGGLNTSRNCHFSGYSNEKNACIYGLQNPINVGRDVLIDCSQENCVTGFVQIVGEPGQHVLENLSSNMPELNRSFVVGPDHLRDGTEQNDGEGFWSQHDFGIADIWVEGEADLMRDDGVFVAKLSGHGYSDGLPQFRGFLDLDHEYDLRGTGQLIAAFVNHDTPLKLKS